MSETSRFNKVLVADDDPVSQVIIAHRLRKLGYRVHVTPSGVEVLDLLERHRYHVVMLDIEMPGLNGIETCRKVIEGVDPDDRPIIIGFSAAKGYEEQALESGMVSFFDKSYLIKNIDQILHTTFTAIT